MTHNFSDVPQTKRDITTAWSYIKGILLVTGLWVALWIAFNIFSIINRQNNGNAT